MYNLLQFTNLSSKEKKVRYKMATSQPSEWNKIKQPNKLKITMRKT